MELRPLHNRSHQVLTDKIKKLLSNRPMWTYEFYDLLPDYSRQSIRNALHSAESNNRGIIKIEGGRPKPAKYALGFSKKIVEKKSLEKVEGRYHKQFEPLRARDKRSPLDWLSPR